MDDTSKYLIHARIAANGVVERSDVVGAVFGQTEGLLGDELDLRDLQQSSKVGRIDVEIDSENGQSFGELTIATSLDKVETAILGASLETITRVGPCRAQLEVTEIEDVRAAKRREVVDRAKELLAEGFDETVMSTEELLAEVRQSARIADITEYEGMPAGPRVVDSEAIIVVEGRADVLRLLKYGIKNAIAVEGTNVPDAIAELTGDRTVTAFLDGDRGGELILKELTQVGDVDYVAFAPPGTSVEDLDRAGVLSALREKVPFELLADEPNVREAMSDRSPGSGGETPHPPKGSQSTIESAGTQRTDRFGSLPVDGTAAVDVDPADRSADEDIAQSKPADVSTAVENGRAQSADVPLDGSDAAIGTPTASLDDGDESAIPTPVEDDERDHTTRIDPQTETELANTESNARTPTDADATTPTDADATTPTDTEADPSAASDTASEQGSGPDSKSDDANRDDPTSLRDHLVEVIDGTTEAARFLDDACEAIATVDAAAAFDELETIQEVPQTIVLDGTLQQRLLDLAAQRGVERIVATEHGEFVKQPIGTRILRSEQLLTPAEA